MAQLCDLAPYTPRLRVHGPSRMGAECWPGPRVRNARFVRSMTLRSSPGRSLAIEGRACIPP